MTTRPSYFKSLPVEYLQRGRYQPRQDFDPKTLEDLAQSIRTQGLIEPLIVRQLSEHQYEIIAGERRWRAAMLANLSNVPCLISDYNDEQAAAVTLIENIQRENLNLIEEAQGYLRLQSEFHFSQDDIATVVGKSRSHIANIVRLLSLSDSVQQRLRQRQLSLGHARMLVGLSPQIQHALAEKAYKQQWSVRRLEEAVREEKNAHQDTKIHTSNHDIHRLQSTLAEQVGSPVQIISENEGSGWLKIKFFNNDTLSGLLERLGLRYD